MKSFEELAREHGFSVGDEVHHLHTIPASNAKDGHIYKPKHGLTSVESLAATWHGPEKITEMREWQGALQLRLTHNDSCWYFASDCRKEAP